MTKRRERLPMMDTLKEIIVHGRSRNKTIQPANLNKRQFLYFLKEIIQYRTENNTIQRTVKAQRNDTKRLNMYTIFYIRYLNFYLLFG